MSPSSSSYLTGLRARLHSRGVWENLTLRAVEDDFAVHVRTYLSAVKAGEGPQEAFYRVFLGQEYDGSPTGRSVAGGPPKASGDH